MKVAISVRVSTQRQALTQTIEQQIQILFEYSQTQQWSWQEEFIFRDDGYGGASLRRPGLDRLRDQVRCAAFDRVLITAPDRLARNSVHQMLLVEEFERGGCQVEFADWPMSQDPHDQLRLQIRGAVAEYERSLIAERMRRGTTEVSGWCPSARWLSGGPSRPRDPAGVRLESTEVAVVAELFASSSRKKGKASKGSLTTSWNCRFPLPVDACAGRRFGGDGLEVLRPLTQKNWYSPAISTKDTFIVTRAEDRTQE